MKTFPYIGISMRLAPHKYFAKTSVHKLSEDYIQSICAAGATPLLLPVLDQGPQLQRLLSLLDALIISGSDNDISPCLWGETPAQTCAQNLAENEFDLFLLRYGWSCGLPVLGICQGHELINVALGGTLKRTKKNGEMREMAGVLRQLRVVDPEKMANCINHDTRLHQSGSKTVTRPRECLSHQVQLNPQSQLAEILVEVPNKAKESQGSEAPSQRLWVNSFHGLCIDRLAPCLEATAVAGDATIEALEWRKDLRERNPFMLGIQWHPEMLCPKKEGSKSSQIEEQLLKQSMGRIFVRLVDEARRFRSTAVSERRAICFETGNEDLQFLPYRRTN